mmetsp:Transcript_86821/g.130200  ORF Transcript_86821/g.130200 Transcript_86821/m.130200 type:complete len:327 (+) Transcript_86821:741-1721(+)
MNHGRLQAQSLGVVDAVLVGAGGIVRSLVDGQVIELRVVSLVNKDDSTGKLLNDKIPRVHGASTGHEMRQNGVGNKDLSNSIDGQLFQDGIVRRGNWVEFLVFHSLERHGLSRRDLVVFLVVLIQESAPQDIFRIGYCRGSHQMLGDLGQIQFLHLDPVRLHGHGRGPIDAIVVVVMATSASTASSPAASTTASATGGSSSATWSLTSHSLLAQGAAATRLLTSRVHLTQTGGVLTTTSGGSDKALRGRRLGSVDQLKVLFGLVVDLLLLLGAAASGTTFHVTTGKVGGSTEAIRPSKGSVRQVGERVAGGSIGVGVVLIRGGTPR